ncbi:MAG TPA: acyltransferase [Flavobacteriales bacterium]|nr:acyltransferase [Flavobacteriales bacterium]
MTATIKNDYFKQLDTLRCIAVFIVIFHHLPVFSSDNFISVFFHQITGVDIFFILSGFLITNILLKSRNKQTSAGRALKTFYVRRFFRIFPIYYLTILALVVINPAHYRDYFLFDLFYVSNIKMGLDGHFSTVSPHFWSLAVEEQFYLFMPILIFITPVRLLKYLLGLLFVSGIVTLFTFYGTSYNFLAMRTFNNLLYLGSGAWLAWIFQNRQSIYDFFHAISIYVLLLYVILVILIFFKSIELPFMVQYLFKFVFCFFLVVKFTVGFKAIAGKIAEFPLFIYLGKISYGLYLYHFLMIIPVSLLNNLSVKYLNIALYSNVYQSNVWKIIFTLITAAISWWLVETRMNRLKEKFAY